MKQVYSLYERSDIATRMIPSQFPILALPTGAWLELVKFLTSTVKAVAR